MSSDDGSCSQKTVFCSWWTLRFFIGKLAMCMKISLDIVPSAPKISGIVLINVPHTHCSSIVKSIYLFIFYLLC